MDTLMPRAPIGALSDVEKFITSAQQLKALTIQRNELRARRSGIENALTRMILEHTKLCNALASQSDRVAEMWKQTQRELKDTDQVTQSQYVK